MCFALLLPLARNMLFILAVLAASVSAGFDLWIKGAGGSTMHYTAGWTATTNAGDIKAVSMAHVMTIGNKA